MLRQISAQNNELAELIVETRELVVNRLDQMSEALRQISQQISICQSLVQRQIDMAVSEEEIERIIQAYANTCTEKIVTDIDQRYSEEMYQREKEKLQYTLGEGAWEKLSEESKTFLMSAKVTYNYLQKNQTVIDYSGVCLLITKALEVEIGLRFGKQYLDYLKQQYPGKRNHAMFPVGLQNRYGHPIRPKDFTLGKVPYILCACFKEKLSEEKKEHDRACLANYARVMLMPEKSDEEILELLAYYGEEIAEVTKEYRNKAAHTNELKRVDAEECFDLVVDVEKLLRRILDSFAY